MCVCVKGVFYKGNLSIFDNGNGILFSFFFLQLPHQRVFFGYSVSTVCCKFLPLPLRFVPELYTHRLGFFSTLFLFQLCFTFLFPLEPLLYSPLFAMSFCLLRYTSCPNSFHSFLPSTDIKIIKASGSTVLVNQSPTSPDTSAVT